MKNKTRAKLGGYSMSGRRMIPSARVWPNGEFTLGYVGEGEEGSPLEEWAWTGGDRRLSIEQLDERLDCLHGWLDCVAETYSVSGKLAQFALTLSSACNSHEVGTQIKYGLHGITTQGTKMLRSAAFILERDYGKEDVTMGTMTVPYLEKAERILLSQSWGRLTDRLLQFLRLELLEQGRPPVIAGCTEIQSSRLESLGEGYLHLHAIWPAHSNRGRRWSVEVDDLRAWWKAAIERIIGRELSHAPRVETAIVENSVEAYLGKYLSKGSDDCLGQFVADLGYESVPGQWWYMSSCLKQKIRGETLTGRNLGELLEEYIEHTVTLGTGSGFQWLRHVDLNIDGRLVTVGYVGRLDRPTRDDLVMLLRMDNNLDLCTVDTAC